MELYFSFFGFVPAVRLSLSVQSPTDPRSLSVCCLLACFYFFFCA